MNVLHIDSSPLGERSASRRLSARIKSRILAEFPDATVVVRDVGLDPPRHAATEYIVRFRNFDVLSPKQFQEKLLSERLVAELLAADIIVVGAPMYNFTITTQLKAWIDRICQRGVTFRYTAEGPLGLLTGKKAIVAATRGGLYANARQAHLDFQVSYLTEIFRFIGISDIRVILAEGLDISPEERRRALDQANRQIDLMSARMDGCGFSEIFPREAWAVGNDKTRENDHGHPQNEF
jgi:FMN-dependent NADH-azoreductase